MKILVPFYSCDARVEQCMLLSAWETIATGTRHTSTERGSSVAATGAMPPPDKEPIQPAVDPKTGARRCPECRRDSAQAGAFWGCKSCKTNLGNGYYWWGIIGAGGCHRDDDE